MRGKGIGDRLDSTMLFHSVSCFLDIKYITGNF